MSFYTVLSENYDEIFETDPAIISFLTGCVRDKNMPVLDVACGTGQYSGALLEYGVRKVEAIDLDPDMIAKARQKLPAVDFRTGSMLELKQFYGGNFGFIFCIGNSIAHLENIEEIGRFVRDTYDMLASGGTLALQTVNYDRIIAGNVRSLPLISRKTLTFRREYEHKSGKVIFTGIIEKDGKKFASSVELLTVMSTDLVSIVKEAGFGNISLYGNFLLDPYEPSTSYSTVLKAYK